MVPWQRGEFIFGKSSCDSPVIWKYPVSSEESPSPKAHLADVMMGAGEYFSIQPLSVKTDSLCAFNVPINFVYEY